MVAYIGNFGAGLLNGYLQMKRIMLQEQWYHEMMKYYEFMMQRAGQSGAGGAYAGGYGGAGQLPPGSSVGRGGGWDANAVPYKGGYSWNDMIGMAKKAGFKGQDAQTMASIAMAESRGNPNAEHINAKDGSTDYGLTQINSSHDGAKDALDPQVSFNKAYDIYHARGDTFKDWTTYNDGSYRNFVPGTTDRPTEYAAQEVGATNAPNGQAPTAFIMHHTAGRGDPASVVADWKNQGKGYGAQYIMDRDGVIHDTAKEFGYNGTNEILNDHTRNLSNSNVVGMEIVANDNNDVTPAQAKAAAAFIQKYYPNTPVYGHGQVNPGHKEADEGKAAVDAVNAARAGGTQAQVDEGTPYQVAGGDVGVSEAGAQRAAADLAAHRAAVTPDEQHTAITDPDVAKAWPGPVPPEETQTVRRAFADEGMTGHGDEIVSPPDRPTSTGRMPLAGTPIGGGPGMAQEAPTGIPVTPQPQHPSTPTPASAYGFPLPPERPKDLTASSLAKGKDADKGTKKAEPAKGKAPEEKGKEAPTKAIPEAPGLPPGTFRYEVPTSSASRAPIYTAHPIDPFWRPNHPLNTVQAQRIQQVAPSTTAQAPTALSQVQQNIGKAFQDARQNISKAISPDVGPATAPATAAAPAAGATQTAQNIPLPPKPPDFGGDDQAPQGPSVQVPDVPPVPTTPIQTTDFFQGQNTGMPTQPGGQMIAQPVGAPYPRRQQEIEEAAAEDQGDQSPAGVLASRKGGPIYRFQAGGVTPVSSQYPSYTESAAATPKQPGLQGNVLAADQYMTSLPGMAPVNLQDPNPLYFTSYGPGQGGIGGQTLNTDFSQMTPAQQQQYNQMLAGTWVPPAAATPAATPAAAPPTTTNTINYSAIAPAVTQVNPASSGTTTTNTATGSPMTWATGQTGTITAPNTSPGVASFGESGVSGTANYYNPYTNTQSGGGGTSYGVSAQDTATNQAGYAAGGPIYKFQAGGMSPAVAAMYSPGYIGPTLTGGWQGTPESQLAPNQQAWANQEQTLLGEIYAGGQQDAAYWRSGGTNPTGPVDTSQWLGQLSVMPTAQTATAPYTGPPQTTNSIVNTSIAPAVTQVNPASGSTGTTTNTATGNPLTWTSGQSGTITAPNTAAGPATFGQSGVAGTSNYYNPYASTNTQSGGTTYGVDASGNVSTYQDGGAVDNSFLSSVPSQQSPVSPAYGIPLAMGYQDGGDVSPASLGAPPGMPMGGQGQQPIPPIYYNQATFSPYGAGVGKGVSYPSSTTLVGSAVPTYAKGGVVAFQEGGDVGADAGSESVQDPGMDQAGYMAEDASYRMGGGFAGGVLPGMSMGRMGGMGMSMRGPGMGRRPSLSAVSRMGGAEGYADPEGNPLYTPEGNLISQQQPGQRPANAPPDMAQINDGFGNLAYGATSAIASVFHFLGNALGIDPQSQKQGIAADPFPQQNRRDFANGVAAQGAGEPSEQIFNEVDGGTNTLNRELRVIGGLEGVYKWHMMNGDPEGAVRAGTSMLMYLNTLVTEYGGRAVNDMQTGNIQGAVDNIIKANENTPNGKLLQAHVNPDTGNTVYYRQTDLNGKIISQGEINAPTLLNMALKIKNGSEFYNQLEQVTYSHDPATREMVKQKQAERQAQLENDAYRSMYGGIPSGPGGPAQGQQQQPKIVPVSDQGGAQSGGAQGGGAPQVTPAAATGPAPSLPAVNGGIPGAPGAGPMPGAGRPGATTGAPTPGPGAPPSGSPEGSAQAYPPEAGPETAGYIRDQPGSQDISLVNQPAEIPVDYGAAKARVDAQYRDPNTGQLKLNVPAMPDTSGMDATTANRVLTRYADMVNSARSDARAAYNSAMVEANRAEEDRAKTRNITQSEMFTTKLKGAEAQEADIRQAHREQVQQLNEAQKLAQKDRQAQLGPRPEKDVDGAYTTSVSASGAVLGKEPMDHLADGLGITSTDEADRNAQIGKLFSGKDATRVGETMVETYRYTQGTTPREVDDTIAGLATGQYAIVPDSRQAITGYGGPPRSAVVVNRQDGTSVRVVIPDQMITNLNAIYNRNKAAAGKSNAPAAAEPAMPVTPRPGSTMAPRAYPGLQPAPRSSEIPQEVPPWLTTPPTMPRGRGFGPSGGTITSPKGIPTPQ